MEHIVNLELLNYLSRYIQLDGCILWNVNNAVFGSKGSAICTTV